MVPEHFAEGKIKNDRKHQIACAPDIYIVLLRSSQLDEQWRYSLYFLNRKSVSQSNNYVEELGMSKVASLSDAAVQNQHWTRILNIDND